MALLSAFNPHDLPEATVRTVATGREGDLADILKTIRDNLGAASLQHLIVSGPRGFGKSFLMRHIQLEIPRIARDESLPLVPVLMPEEMPHVKEPETLVRELTRALTGGAGADAELTWHEDEGSAWDAAVAELITAIRDKVGETGLVVALVENFDLLLRRAFPKDLHRSRLRALLTRAGGRLMLIAASASGAFDRDYDGRLFQAFREIALTPWTIDECLDFFDRQRRDAGKAPLDELTKARAKAVATFIGGTPRLATLLGDALLGDDVLGAAQLLQKLVDELTPYYKERIEALPGRSQKLLDALLRGGEPATQSEIARRVKANSQAAIAGPFNDLVRERVVVGEKAPGSAEILYRVADRVFAHYYRRRVVDHGQSGCALEAMVDLLATFFTPEEKQAKASEFARKGLLPEARVMARLHDADRGTSKEDRQWMLHYLANDIIPNRLLALASATVADDLRMIGDLAINGEIDRAYRTINEALASATQSRERIVLLLVRSRLDAYEGIEAGLAAAAEASAISDGLRGDDDAVFAAQLGRLWSLAGAGHFAEVVETGRGLAEQAAASGRPRDHATAVRYAAYSLSQLARHDEAIVGSRLAADLAERAGDMGGRATALHHAAASLGQLDRHDEAVATARQAVALSAQAGDIFIQAAALRNAAFSLSRLGRHDEAVATARQAADLAERVRDTREQAVALRYAAFSLGELDRYDEAVATAREAADLAQRGGDREELAEALLTLASNLDGFGSHQEAIETLARSASMMPTSGRDYLSAASRVLGWRQAIALAGSTNNLEQMHTVLRTAAETLDLEGLRRLCLDTWLEAFAEDTISLLSDHSRLVSLADAIDLHFPGRFETLTGRLRDAARYHESGRDRAALARLDPDFAQALATMFPPVERAPPKPRKGRASPSRKPGRGKGRGGA